MLDHIMGSMISDRAAKGVAGYYGIEEEVCLMHDGDKLGASAIGHLVRTKNKKEVNPFPQGKALLVSQFYSSYSVSSINSVSVKLYSVGTRARDGEALLIW